MYSRMLLNWAYRKLGDRNRAEDLAQEVLLQVFAAVKKNCNEKKPVENVELWLSILILCFTYSAIHIDNFSSGTNLLEVLADATALQIQMLLRKLDVITLVSALAGAAVASASTSSKLVPEEKITLSLYVARISSFLCSLYCAKTESLSRNSIPRWEAITSLSCLDEKQGQTEGLLV